MTPLSQKYLKNHNENPIKYPLAKRLYNKPGWPGFTSTYDKEAHDELFRKWEDLIKGSSSTQKPDSSQPPRTRTPLRGKRDPFTPPNGIEDGSRWCERPDAFLSRRPQCRCI